MEHNINDELAIIDEYNHYLDNIRNLNAVLVEKLKEKETFIIHLTEELTMSKKEISELNKEIHNLMTSHDDALRKIEKERVQLICEIELLNREMYQMREKNINYQLDYATAQDNYEDIRMGKVRPIDKNGNMKK